MYYGISIESCAGHRYISFNLDMDNCPVLQGSSRSIEVDGPVVLALDKVDEMLTMADYKTTLEAYDNYLVYDNEDTIFGDGEVE